MAISSKPTHFKNGVTNATITDTLGGMGQMDPTLFHSFWDDFDNYLAAEWVVTETQAGATQALSNADGGVLLLTNSAADDDIVALQWAGNAGSVYESFLFETGKKLWFKARMKVSDATQSDFVMGLQIADTTPLDVTDGVFFQKDDGDANLDFHVEKNNTATTASAIATVSDDTYLTMGFEYDGVDNIKVYVDDSVTNLTVATTNLPDDEELAVSFAIQNGEAAAKTMSIDYIYVAKER